MIFGSVQAGTMIFYVQSRYKVVVDSMNHLQRHSNHDDDQPAAPALASTTVPTLTSGLSMNDEDSHPQLQLSPMITIGSGQLQTQYIDANAPPLASTLFYLCFFSIRTDDDDPSPSHDK